jgi:homoserine dehydrogenase
MSKNQMLNIALLGCGKLGQGIYTLWQEQRQKILEKSGIDLNIKYILVKNIRYKRNIDISPHILVDSADIILKDDSVKIVIDAIGGIEPTFGIIKKFLTRGCHLVSANRALLAGKMREIFELASSRHIHVQFNAALGGGIPIIHTLRRDLIATRILSIWGVASGTSNYILSEMTSSKKSLKEILNSADISQLSEGHMLLDYEGSDSAQKLSLLAATTFGIQVNYLQIHAEGISAIKPIDIQFAQEFGYKLKLLAIIKDREAGVELRVHPTLVPEHHPLASVDYDYNALFIQTDTVGELMLYGKGAGVYPAATMVLRDVVDVATSLNISSSYMYGFPVWKEKPVIPISSIISQYYLRFQCLNVPGVIGKIATVLGDNRINIESTHASSIDSKKKNIKISFVHIFTEPAPEHEIMKSLATIRKMKIIRGEIVLFRILGESSYGIRDFNA